MTHAGIDDQPQPRSGEAGFTYTEVLVASLLLAISLLAMCSVFVSGFSDVISAGKNTIGVTAARQMLEDVRSLPYDSIASLNGFDTDNAATLPASDPALELARRWRYVLAGAGVGWTFTSTETTRWTSMNGGGTSIRGAGRITVTSISATLSEVTVTLSVPGRWRSIVFTTRVAKL